MALKYKGHGEFTSDAYLRTCIIPDGYTSIGRSAFEGFPIITNVIIPDSVRSIGKWAFRRCNEIKSITFPVGIVSLGEDPFDECEGLLEINVEKGNPIYTSVDGVLFNKKKTELILYPSGRAGIYTVPDGTESIADDAFHTCTKLEGIVIPPSVKSIGEKAFYCCTSLKSIVIPEGITSLEYSTFRCCRSLESVVFPSSLKSICQTVFWGSDKIASITIKAAEPPEVDGGDFFTLQKEPSQLKIYVPPASVDAYKAAECWREYADCIQAIQPQ